MTQVMRQKGLYRRVSERLSAHPARTPSG